MTIRLAIKIDIDTEKGTREGVPGLLKLLDLYNIKATFLFSLGPDNTGRAIRRIFRPGFLKKVNRTSVLKVYGARTLLNGILWPGPHIARRHYGQMQEVRESGHEVGIHCYDHIRWQDGLEKMTMRQVREELERACSSFREVFKTEARTAGAAGWQANHFSFQAYDEAGFLYGSDCRGTTPFFPQVGQKVFRTLQIPTTLPTLDELMGRPNYPLENLAEHFVSLLQPSQLNVLTIHAELEGMLYKNWFEEFLKTCQAKRVEFVLLSDSAESLLSRGDSIPICKVVQSEIDGRSGTLALQGAQVK
ncbi:MAG: 4-deoxy-4-formamido-L-arabinose-phosphoundecaprenol deformylase [Alphaproteobacteria bacterium]|nr:4-deoxy-4-formamido-L-arabinose-phosphoundecaprenol deformylase [Alphaproteobacteria bacterium]